jgi:hypothetical protein
MTMKLTRLMKIVGLSVVMLAVLTLAAPGYAWTHGGGFGNGHYTGHHYYHGSDYGFRHHVGWGNGYGYSGGYYYPYYSPYYYEPYVSPGFGLVLPGFSFYVGP